MSLFKISPTLVLLAGVAAADARDPVAVERTEIRTSSGEEMYLREQIPAEGRMMIAGSSRSPYASIPRSTPAGITLQMIPGLFPIHSAKGDSSQWVLAGADGRTLYTLTAPLAAGQTKWLPASPPGQMRPRGDWGFVRGARQVRQMTYRGEPLFTYADDSRPGEAKGISSVAGEGREKNGPAVALATLQAPGDFAAPAGIRLAVLADMNGRGLVDASGKSIYVYRGSKAQPRCAAQCPWLAVRAPVLGRPVGDFVAVVRPEGYSQWAYRGRPLYTFAGDASAGETKGAGADADWQVALVDRFFLPDAVEIRNFVGVGPILTRQGAPLYQRDQYHGTVGGRGVLPRSYPIFPESGRRIGTLGCNEACEKEWQPFLANGNAQAADHWAVLTRSDGKKQWAYKGFALYTRNADTPGTIGGNNVVDIIDLSGSESQRYFGLMKTISTEVERQSEVPYPSSALFWHVTYP